jgi:hypothetical protein
MRQNGLTGRLNSRLTREQAQKSRETVSRVAGRQQQVVRRWIAATV